jgi:membrane protease YdiL (CAAX protease family)
MDSNKELESSESELKAAYPRNLDAFQPNVPELLPRNYSGWIFLFVIFALWVGLELFQPPAEKKQLRDVTRLDFEVKDAILTKANPFPVVKGATNDPNSEVKDLIKEIGNDRFTDSTSALIYGLMEYELGKPVSPKDVEAVKKMNSTGGAMFQVLTTPKFSPVEARSLERKLTTKTFAGKLLKADLEAKANLPAERNQLFQSLRAGQGPEAELLVLLFSASIMAWFILLSQFRKGELRPLGLPNLPASLGSADQLAGRAVIFFSIYLGLGVLSGLFSIRSGGGLLAGVLTILAYPLAVRNPFTSLKTSFASLGMERGSPWMKYLCLGLFGFLLEFPISMAMSGLGQKLLPNQTYAHPAETQLATSHSPLVVASLFLLACVQAPLFEETFFRGLLFPALTKVTRSVLAAIAINSLLFASLHPQGMGAWLGLGTIAAASSLMIYYTKSLAPSIFLHVFHNVLTLVVAMLLS